MSKKRAAPSRQRSRTKVTTAQMRAAHPRGQTKVDYEQDAPHAPARTRDQLAALSLEHTSTRQQLDALRKTRGQRDVGAVTIPVHLKHQIVESADYRDGSGHVVRVRESHIPAAVLPPED